MSFGKLNYEIFRLHKKGFFLFVLTPCFRIQKRIKLFNGLNMIWCLNLITVLLKRVNFIVLFKLELNGLKYFGALDL